MMTGRRWLVLLACVGALLAIPTRFDAAAAAISGRWVGFEEREGRRLSVAFDFSQSTPLPPVHVDYYCPMDPQITSTESGTCPICKMTLSKRFTSNCSGRFTSEPQGIAEYPLDTVSYSPPNLHLELGGGDTIFDGLVSAEEISGTIHQRDGQGRFALRNEAPPAPPYDRRDVSFSNGEVRLSGTLLVPATPGRHAAVVLLHGSGPQTRWGTPLFLAERFARDGIAALAFDKRGSGASTGDVRTATYDELAGDAAAAVDFVRSQHGIDPTRVGIFGHSEGAMIAPLVASRSSKTAFLVAADGHAGPLADQELYRVHNLLRDSGFGETNTRRALAFFGTWMDVAATGKGLETVEALLPTVRNEPWFPLVAPPDREDLVWKTYPARAGYDALPYWRRVKAPVLIVFGESDRTVDPATGIARTMKALESAGNREVAAVLLPGARHNLTIPGSEKPFEWWKLAPGYPEIVIAWVLRETR